MNRRQTNRHDMHARVLLHFDTDPALWEAHAPIAEEVAALRLATDAIDTTAQQQHAADTAGLTDAKDAAEEAMIAAAVVLAGPLRAYARKTGDHDLLHQVDHSASDYRQADDETALRMATDVLAAAEAHAAGAAPYGVTAERITTLREATAAFHPSAAVRDLMMATRSTATTGLRGHFSAAASALDFLDDLVPALVADGEFVARYAEARRITDR